MKCFPLCEKYKCMIIANRGSVRGGATGAIAPVNFQKTPIAPVDFLKTFRKEEKLTVFDWIWDLHPSFKIHYGAPGKEIVSIKSCLFANGKASTILFTEYIYTC